MAPSGVELNKVSALRNLLSLLTGKFPMGSLGGKKRERNESQGPLKNYVDQKGMVVFKTLLKSY